MRVNSAILTVIFLLASTDYSYAATPPYFRARELNVSMRSDYYWTNANYDQSGETQNLLGTNTYTNLTNTLDGIYFWSSEWALRSGLNFSYAKSQGTLEDRTNNEVSEVHASLIYKYANSIISLMPEFDVALALNRIDPFSDDAITNDGTNTFRVGSWAYGSLRALRLKTYAYLGFEHRDDGRSALMPWTAGLGWRGQRWQTSFEAGGYESVSDDEFTNNRFQRETLTNSVNAGSLRYYSVNPRLIEARAEIGYAISRKFFVNGGLTSSLMGESVAKGQSIFIGLAYNFSPMSAKLGDAYESKPSQFEFNLEEDYDESLFEDE